MAMVGLRSSRVKQDMELYLPASVIEGALRRQGHRFRVRLLTPALSVHLLLLQLLHQTALSGLRHLANVPATASAICQARARLPLSLFYFLVEHVAAALTDAMKVPGEALFHGHPVMLLDAMSFHTQDTAPLARHYGKHKNQRRGSPGYPTPKLLCLIHHATGIITRAIDLPAFRQEYACLRRVLTHMLPGQVLLGDRGLTSFLFLCGLVEKKAHACLRLSRLQVAGDKGSRRTLERLGPGDLLVRWDKSPRRSTTCSRRAYAALPGHLVLRQITYDLSRRGFRPSTIVLITTLLDPVKYPAEDLSGLYLRRWQIEVFFRDLKRTQGLDRLTAKTIAGVRKALLGHVLLYNLVRAVMFRAADRQHVAASRISFLDALRHLRCAAAHAGDVSLISHRHRHRASEPRRIKTRQYRFQSLTKPRAQYKTPPPPKSCGTVG